MIVADLRLTLFGAPRLLHVRTNDLPGASSGQTKQQKVEQLRLSRRKALALLAYLAVTGKTQARESLVAQFWPDTETSLAYSYLRRELAILNKTLREGTLDVDRDSVTLNPAKLWVDVTHFWHLLSLGASHNHPENDVCALCLPPLSEAVELYRDSFMAGFSLADNQNFAEWQSFERAGLHRGLMETYDKLVRGYIARGEFNAAIRSARRWLNFEASHEQAHRQLMRLYVWTGNQVAALNQYQECVRILAEEVDQQPEATTQELYLAIKSHALPAWTPPEDSYPELASPATVVQADQSAFNPPDSDSGPATNLTAPSPPHNLPSEPTPFVGREDELAQIGQLLLQESGCRMISLVGPGGIGKTRLAVRAARQALNGFQNGVYLVSLAPISSIRLLVPAIADALGLTSEGTPDLKTRLVNYLRQKKILLVLDNFEHLLDPPVVTSADAGSETLDSGEDLLVDILASAPHVKLLVTSRERLNLREEWIIEIGGLTYPASSDAGDPPRVDISLTNYSAVKLFIETARRTQPKFALAKADQAAVVEICRLVEGMPLGIELASVWVGLIPLQELIREIHRSLDFLTSPIRNIPDRHRSLRALFAHSWQLLTAPERQLVSRLSIFKGSFSRTAAVDVADASLPLLKSLIDKSMLRGSPAGQYEMHEIIRQYAAEKLKETPEAYWQVAARHARYYATFLQKQEDGLLNEQRQPLARIAARIDNVSAAWDWVVKHSLLNEIRQSLVSLHLFYFRQGWIQEGEATFRQAAASVRQMNSRESGFVLGQLLARRGHFAYRLGLHRQAKELLTESLAIFRQQSEDGSRQVHIEIAQSLYYLSATIRADGEYGQAKRYCQESLAMYQADSNYRGMASTLKLLGIIAGTLGDYKDAEHHFQQALELYQNLHDQVGVANTLNDLGIVADRKGQYAEAKQLHEKCLAIRRKSGNLWGIGTSLNNLGILVYNQGDYAEARELLQESLGIQEEIGDQYHIANCLANLGSVSCALGDFDEARQAFFKGLKFAVEIGAVPLILEILAGVATLFVSMEPGWTERAANLFSFVKGHSGSETLTKNKAEAGLAGLASRLPAEVLASARTTVESNKLDLVVAEVLGELDRTVISER